MIQLLAVIGVIAIAVLLWKAFSASRPAQSRRQQPPQRALGPDDDPDFLWRLARDTQRKRQQGDQ